MAFVNTKLIHHNIALCATDFTFLATFGIITKENKGKRFMTPHRINARLSGPLADHVAHVVGPDGLYETPSEYIRALIRQDMAQGTAHIYAKIREGLEDIAQGRILKSHGTWEHDKAALRKSAS